MSFFLLSMILCSLFDAVCRWFPPDVHPFVLLVDLILIGSLLTASLLLYITSLCMPVRRQYCIGQMSSW